MSLEDDIARVARLRGAPVALQINNGVRDNVKRTIYMDVGLAYKLAGYEARVYEALPPGSRLFLQQAPFDIAPSVYALAFTCLGDERAVMMLIEEIFREHRRAGRIEDCTTMMMAQEGNDHLD